MAKIIVYEDSNFDLVSRYSELNRKHDVHVQAWGDLLDILEGRGQPGFLIRDYRNLMEKAGFDLSRMKPISEDVEEADAYFVDGLKGMCLYLLEKLPKDRTFLVTEDPSLREKAGEKGWKNPESLEAVLKIRGQ